MKEATFSLPGNSVIRYIVIGGFSYLVELSFIYLLKWLGANDVVAVGIGFWVGLIISFILQKIIVFQNKEKQRKQLLWQTITYALLVIFNYLFTLWFVWMFTITLSLLAARTCALLITTGWNFVLYKTVIFRSAQPTNAK